MKTNTYISKLNRAVNVLFIRFVYFTLILLRKLITSSELPFQLVLGMIKRVYDVKQNIS